MAFKGTAGKSSSGASMSKYDVEVEARLQALEKVLLSVRQHVHQIIHLVVLTLELIRL